MGLQCKQTGNRFVFSSASNIFGGNVLNYEISPNKLQTS